jgi:hypothetical protein
MNICFGDGHLRTDVNQIVVLWVLLGGHFY